MQICTVPYVHTYVYSPTHVYTLDSMVVLPCVGTRLYWPVHSNHDWIYPWLYPGLHEIIGHTFFFTHAYNYVSCASTSVSRNAIMWRVIQPRSHIPAHVYTRVLVYPYTLTPRYVWIAWSQPHYSQIHASRFVYTHTVRTLYELASTKSGAHNMRSSILPHLGPGAERLRVHTESRMSIHKRTDACHQMCLTRPRHLHTLVHSSFHITLHV